MIIRTFAQYYSLFNLDYSRQCIRNIFFLNQRDNITVHMNMFQSSLNLNTMENLGTIAMIQYFAVTDSTVTAPANQFVIGTLWNYIVNYPVSSNSKSTFFLAF